MSSCRSMKTAVLKFQPSIPLPRCRQSIILALPTWRKRYKRNSGPVMQDMQQMMDGGMMWGDLGGLIGLILLVLIIAAFVAYVFRR
jgi:hypothetical protein